MIGRLVPDRLWMGFGGNRRIIGWQVVERRLRPAATDASMLPHRRGLREGLGLGRGRAVGACLLGLLSRRRRRLLSVSEDVEKLQRVASELWRRKLCRRGDARSLHVRVVRSARLHRRCLLTQLRVVTTVSRGRLDMPGRDRHMCRRANKVTRWILRGRLRWLASMLASVLGRGSSSSLPWKNRERITWLLHGHWDDLVVEREVGRWNRMAGGRPII